jgi:uncharacterized protein (DUF1697 family)
MTYLALLRGINVGGRRSLAMVELRSMAEALGFGDVKTFIQSGNLVFSAKTRTPASLETLLEKETAKRFDMQVAFHVRAGAEWQAMIAANPFPREAAAAPNRLLAVCMKSAPSAAAAKALHAAIPGGERVKVIGREAFIYFPDGQGVSKLTPALIERTLGGSGTGRNWNTVLKLDALVNGGG